MRRSLILLAALAACVTDPVTNEKQFSVVEWTPEEEQELGRTFAPNIESQFDAVHPDPEAQAYLGQLVASMVELSPRRDDFDFHFKVLNSSIPNAFALPGGYVYITRGLLTQMETEGQFIFALGHELGHVERRHAMLNQSSGTLMSLPTRPLRVLSNILPVGGRVVGAAAAVAETPFALLGLKYSREQELEADERGVYFADAMGYDPRDANKTFEVLQQLEKDAPKLMEFSIFRTHPLNEDRIQGVQEIIATQYPEVATRTDFRATSEPFAAITRGLRQKAASYARYDEAQAEMLGEEEPSKKRLGELQEQLALSRQEVPDEPLFCILSAEVALNLEQRGAAVQALRQAEAIYQRLSPGDGHWKVNLYLGVLALTSSDGADLEEAVLQLETAVERYPMNANAHFFLARAYEASDDTSRAVASYRKVLELAPEGEETYQQAEERLDELE